jgi:hypothetical protein
MSAVRPVTAALLPSLLAGWTLLSGPAALAQEVVTELPEVELERIPPSYSYDIGIQIGAGDLTYWRDEVPVWATLGFFASWGAHYRGNDRFGPGLAFIAEGPIPLHASYSGELTFRWDRMLGEHIAVGAAAGGALMVHTAMRDFDTEVAVTPAPVVAARFGWAQNWTRVGRRLFVVAEPKARVIAGRVNYGISIQVGSTSGY